MKKIITICTFLMLFASIFSQTTFTVDGIKFSTISDNNVEVRYDDTYKGSINIPSTVVYLGVTYNVISIGYSAFSYCTDLTSITIPNSVISIGSSAFSNCTSLMSITIPNSVISIGNSAFSYCSSLTSIFIPNSVTSIGAGVFSGCTSLMSITIPNSVTSIGAGVFSGCKLLKTIKLNADNTNFSSEDGVLFNKDKTQIICFPDNSAVYTIPNSVNSIGDFLFSNCRNLTSIIIPNSVTSIGNSAFQACTGLTSITIPNSVTSIGSSAFESCTSLTSISFPDSVTSVGNKAFNYTEWYNSQPDGLVYAGKVAYKFKGTMPANTTITLNDGTIGIASGVFFGFTDLTSITIPNSVVSIGESAFEGCSSLTSITIPENVISIEKYAFRYCTELASITIPNSVTSIGSGAFAYTNWYNRQPNGLVYAGKVAYKYIGIVPANTSITLNEGTTGITDYAFSSCNNGSSITIPSITIPKSVTSIGEYAFEACQLKNINVDENNAMYSSLNGVLFNKSKTHIICYPIRNLAKNYTIPNSVTLIANSAFYLSNLTSVTIPTSVISIGNSAFSYTELTSVTIPNSVTSIGISAFYYSPYLTSIYANAINPINLESSSNVFYQVNKACVLYVPEGSKVAYQAANQWRDFKNIVETTTEAPQLNELNLSISLNSTNNYIKINGLECNANVNIYNANGQILMARQVMPNDAICVSALPQGVYILKVNSSEGTFQSKFLIK